MDTALCAFVDLLGIGDRIKSKPAQEDQIRLAKEFNELFSFGFGWIKDESGKEWAPQVRTFTDNIFIFKYFERHITDSEEESGFAHVLRRCSSSQLRLAMKGQLLRGGFDIGFMSHDEFSIIGSGLIRAYELEKNKAKNPRIILSNRIANLISLHLSYYAKPEDSPHNRDVIWCHDGIFMLNYLDDLRAFTDDGLPDPDSLRVHRDVIIAGVNNGNEKIRAKHLWLGAYHDWFCKEYDQNHFKTDTMGKDCYDMFDRICNVLPVVPPTLVKSLRESNGLLEFLESPLKLFAR